MAVEWLRDTLPAKWSIETRAETGPNRPDITVTINATNVFATLVIETRQSFEPRDVGRMFGSMGRTLRELNPHTPLMVVAPWLSPRTRELLEGESINYLDQTGNARLRLDNPAVFVQTSGAQRSPIARASREAKLTGAKAARVVRTLLDCRPPYGVIALAEAAGVNAGYVSQILDALTKDALIKRSRRGGIDDVDVVALLKRWSGAYDVFDTNNTRTYVAPDGATAALARATDLDVAVTGSFAAVRYAAVAAPTLLCAYYATGQLTDIEAKLNLLPAAEGANVALLDPFDVVVWQGTEIADGVRYAALPQVAVDCLTGNGRMPAEGDALTQWMVANEASWREPALRLRDASSN